MPVTVILSEGVSGSPDVRILGKLLEGRCEIKPSGSKYGLGACILARREATNACTTYGLIDGDFVQDWHSHRSDEPKRWETSDRVHLGWRWARKEIENYIIDPTLVSKALGDAAPNAEAYHRTLFEARNRISDYEAARTALAVSRPRFQDLPSNFGRPRGKEKHPIPDVFDERSCRQGLRQVIEAHQSTQLVDLSIVERQFESLLPECRSGGVRYHNFMAAFAGKDLLWAMDDDLRTAGFGGAPAFREKVLVGIASTTEDIADWLIEWKRLRKMV